MKDNYHKKKELSAILLVMGLVSLLTGVTFAFFNYTRTGTVNNIGTGRIYFNSTQNGRLQLTNIFPVKESEVNENELDSVTVGIIGDTTYPNGEEYLISFVNVNNIVNGKKIPINYMASYEPVTDKVIGTKNDDYWNAREDKNANIYLLNETGGVVENKQILVGFIKNDNTGINGTLTIKAYIDADRIAISDTYDGSEDDNHGTTYDWVNDRTVFTTEEWNSFQTSGTPISFQIRAESNEGIWVDNSTPASCFELMPAEKSYSVNTSMNESELNTCVSYINDLWDIEINPLPEGETLEAFCQGTGTVDGNTFQNYLDWGEFENRQLDYLEEHNIIIDNGYKVGIEKYDASCGSDVIIPKTVSAIKNNYSLNSNMTESELYTCVSYFNDLLNIENNQLDEGETIESFCQGTGTAWGNTFQQRLDNNWFYQDALDYLEEHNIISNNKETVEANVTYIDDYAFNSKNLTSVEIPNSVTGIGYDAFHNNNITTVNIDMENIPDSLFYYFDTITNLTIGEHVKVIGRGAFSNNNISGTLTIPDSVIEIGGGAFMHNQLSNVIVSDEYFDKTSQYICKNDVNSSQENVIIPPQLFLDSNVTITNRSGTKQCISKKISSI